MTIDWLKDRTTGLPFYPVTHEDAVIDSNGVTLSTKLEDLELSADSSYSKFLRLYLAFEAIEAGTFTLTIGANVSTSYVTSISYSLDSGITWTTTNNVDSLAVTITTPTIAIGDKVLWKGQATALATTAVVSSLAAASRLAEVCNFSSTGSYDISGNIMSLLYNDDFKDKDSFAEGSSRNFALLFYGYDATTGTKIHNAENLIFPAKICPDYCYYRIFQSSEIVTPPHVLATSIGDYGCANFCYKCLSLIRTSEIGATTMGTYGYAYAYYSCTSLVLAYDLINTSSPSYCCAYMFYLCTALTKAPDLPATTLSDYCYIRMFYGCTSLIDVLEELPAMTLGLSCYREMFRGCTSLKRTSNLPATTLANLCYLQMYFGCTSLTLALEILPAMTLTNLCYAGMFTYCSSLTKAPELPATTLASGCYDSMLAVTSISYIKCLATDISASECTSSWVELVAATGTFIKSDNNVAWTTGNNGIPTGWNVYTKSEYEVVRHYELASSVSHTYVRDVTYDLRLWVDSFTTVNTLQVYNNFVTYDINDPDMPCSPVKVYKLTNNTITIDGTTCYIWEYYAGDYVDSSKYLLTTTNTYSSLFSLSLEDNVNNDFTSFYGFLNEESLFNTYDVSRNTVRKLVKIEQTTPLTIYVDEIRATLLGSGSTFLDYFDNPRNTASNSYILTDNTITISNITYYIWEKENYGNIGVWSVLPKYLLTTTKDYTELTNASLLNSIQNLGKVGILYNFMLEDNSLYDSSNFFREIIKVERI